MEIQKPEIYKPINVKKLMDKLLGFDEWVAKNKREHYKKYNPKK